MDLDPDMVAALRVRAKRQIRQRMRALRQALPESALAERSRRIVARLVTLPEFERARRVALFWPMEGRGEVDLRELDAAARQADKELYYPFLDREGARPGFRRVDGVSELVEQGSGFAEPRPTAPEAAAGALDLVVVPALAVNETGFRIGYGSGFYDRVLPLFCPPARSVVVAFEFQLLAELPTAPEDVACDRVVVDDTRAARGVPGSRTQG